PRALPAEDQGGLRPRPEAREPHARSILPEEAAVRAGRLAQGRRARRRVGRREPGLRLGAFLLRRVPERRPTGVARAGAARLLRRAYLRADRRAARPALPHRLAGLEAPAARSVAGVVPQDAPDAIAVGRGDSIRTS